MSAFTISVVPKTIVKEYIVTNVTYRVMSLDLGKELKLFVTTVDSNGNIVSNDILTMDGTAYDLWGLDDAYVTQFVLEHLGYTEQVEEPAAVVEEVAPVVEEPAAVVEEPAAVVEEPPAPVVEEVAPVV